MKQEIKVTNIDATQPLKVANTYTFMTEGAADYAQLINKPSINNVPLIGNKTSAELGIKQDALISGDNIKTINGTSILGSGNISTPNTTYSEISSTEITAGTSSTSRAISGRRSQEIVNKARNGLVEGNANANNIVSNIFIGTQQEYDALPNKTGILAIIEE